MVRLRQLTSHLAGSDSSRTADHQGLVGSVARRVGWGFADQALSSGSNFALSAFVAAKVSATGFGAFSIVYAIYNVCAGFSAGLVSVPLIVRYSAASTMRARDAIRSSVGGACVVGLGAGIICALAASLTSSALTAPLAALGLSCPGLLAQDAWRYGFVTSGRPAKAAANDGLWTGLQLAAIAALLSLGDVTAFSMVLVWGGSATIAALFGCWQAQAVPAPSRAVAFLREEPGLTWRYAAEVLLHRSGSWMTLTVVGAVAGVRVLGAIRGAVLLLGGPLNLVFLGASFAFASEGVRLRHRAPLRLSAAMARISAGMSAIALGWCVVVLLLPDQIGSYVLGATWHQAQPLLPIFIVMMVSLAASIGAVQGMLSLGAARRSLFTQAVSVGFDLPLMTAGAIVAGAPGAAIATSLTAIFRTGLAWIQFRRALHESTITVDLDAPPRQVTEAPAG